MHSGSQQCIREFFLKLLATGKVAAKYYAIFHLFPFLIKLAKCKDINEVHILIVKAGLGYGGSIAFLSLLVGLLRAALCIHFSLPESA